MDITFIISHVPDPKISKRIKIAKCIGETNLIYWNRETMDCFDIVHNDIENMEIKISANYTDPLKRIVPTLKFMFFSLKILFKIQPKILYISNLDMLTIAYLYRFMTVKKPKIFYEIADLNKLIADEHNTLNKKIIKKMLIRFERILTKKVDILVLTSEKFYDFYYSKFFPNFKTIYIPNMPDLEFFKNFERKKTGEFTVGFIGVVRYKEQMKLLVQAAEKTNTKVLIAGVGHDNEIEELCEGKNNIRYYGKYNYETEASDLYSRLDCVYSVYDADLNNVRIALPNKLFESIYCTLPIIVAKGTYLSELVEKMGVGLSVNHKDLNELCKAFVRLKNDIDYYNNIVCHCMFNRKNIDIENYNAKLKEAMKKALNELA